MNSNEQQSLYPPNYGNAQIMYVKRGYVPDGRGVSQRESFLKYGDEITVNDDLALCLTKRLSVKIPANGPVNTAPN